MRADESEKRGRERTETMNARSGGRVDDEEHLRAHVHHSPILVELLSVINIYINTHTRE